MAWAERKVTTLHLIIKKKTKGRKIRMLNDFPITFPQCYLNGGKSCFLVRVAWLSIGAWRGSFHKWGPPHTLTGSGGTAYFNCSKMSSEFRDLCRENCHLYGRKGRMEDNPSPRHSHRLFGTWYSFYTGSCFLFHSRDPDCIGESSTCLCNK